MTDSILQKYMDCRIRWCPANSLVDCRELHKKDKCPIDKDNDDSEEPKNE